MTAFSESKLSKLLTRAIIAPEDRSPLLALATPIYCPDYNGVRAQSLNIIKPTAQKHYVQYQKITDDTSGPVTTSDTEVSVGGTLKVITTIQNGVTTVTNEFTPDENIVTINLNKSVKKRYSVPYELDLKTDVNLMNLIKADMLVEFKKAVNNELNLYITSNKSSITKIEAGTNLANTIGNVITNYITKGTGCRFSIYGYDNGAPVSFITNENQLSFPQYIKSEGTENGIISINDVNVPSMYYFANPSLILTDEKFKELQTGLVNGTIKSYAREKLNFSNISTDISEIGTTGIAGSNDVIALAFTEPRITQSSNTNNFGYTISMECSFGIALVNPDNIGIIE